MGEVIAPLEVIVGLLVLFGVILGGFVARRHILARNPATFDCSFRQDLPRKPGGWKLGVARYEEDRLEWFRIFTIDPRPGKILQRAKLDLIEWHPPSEPDIHSVLPGALVVRCSYGDELLDLAMTRRDYTGFVTWLESAPPGKQPFDS